MVSQPPILPFLALNQYTFYMFAGRFTRWVFPLGLALSLIAIQIGLALFMHAQAGPERVWLGDYLWNAGDQAVYLGYIEQAKQGSLVLKNLYAPESTGRFIHPIYLPLGWLARLLNLTAIQAHEVGKSIVLITSIFLLHAVARNATKTESEARIATITMALGGGLGWILVVHQALLGFFPEGFFVPDVASEMFFFPTILGGAHIPLSAALLIYTLRKLWTDISESAGSKRTSIISSSALLFIHPYFAPLLAVYGWTIALIKHLSWRQTLLTALVYAPFVSLALFPHVWSYWHDDHRRFFLEKNHLPLATLTQHLFALLPWLGFLIWRRYKEKFHRQEKWIMIWTVTALVLISLPMIHFKRKLLESLGLGIMLLALPVWLHVLTWAKRTGRIAHVSMWAMLVLSPLCLLQSQITWTMNPMGYGDEFFVPKDLEHAWSWIRTHTDPNDLILPDTTWVGIWTAPNTLRGVWIGHDHETPNWKTRKVQLEKLWKEEDPGRVQKLLKDTHAKIVVTTSQEKGIFMQNMARNDWQEAARFGQVRIWR